MEYGVFKEYWEVCVTYSVNVVKNFEMFYIGCLIKVLGICAFLFFF